MKLTIPHVSLRNSPRLPLKTFTSITVIATALGLSAAAYAFAPNRPTYTVANPASHVTLDSITDNPRQGDERSFFSVADASNPTPDVTAHQITVHDGQEISLRVYVNNDANESLNGTKLNGSGVAKNTRVRITLPTISGNTLQVMAYVSADNATPKTVSDSLNVASDASGQNFSLAYEPGTATLSNNAVGSAGLKLSDNIVKNGVQIGYSKADGMLPAWFQYAGVVTLKAKVHAVTASATAFTVSQTVALPTDKTWSKTVTASPGAKVKYSVGFTNTGTSQLDSVTVSNMLPAGTAVVKGSAKLFNSTNKNGKGISDSVATTTGVNIGTYSSNANGYVQFMATMPAADKLNCGENDLTNTSQASAAGTNLTDTTVVKITKTCTTPPAASKPTTPAPATSTPAPTTTTPSNLTNTGPGNIVALFVVAVLVGLAGRYVYLAKRLPAPKNKA